MHKRVFILFISVLFCCAEAAPRSGTGVMACLGHGCDLDSGPVCAVDDSGLPRTFENRCMADLAYCRSGTYFAMVKPGEC